MLAVLYSASLVAIFVCCLAGTLSRKFDDNLLQRVGMSFTCIAVFARLSEVEILLEYNNHIRYLLTYGVAIYCIGTAYRAWRQK